MFGTQAGKAAGVVGRVLELRRNRGRTHPQLRRRKSSQGQKTPLWTLQKDPREKRPKEEGTEPPKGEDASSPETDQDNVPEGKNNVLLGLTRWWF